MRNEKVQKLTLTALMAALSYVIFTFLQIKVTLPGGSATSFHLGNAVVVLAALLLGGVYGGIGGAIGMQSVIYLTRYTSPEHQRHFSSSL